MVVVVVAAAVEIEILGGDAMGPISPPPHHISCIFGFLERSTLTRGGGCCGGTHVPFRMASSISWRWRLRRMRERKTMAAEMARSRTRVARNV